MRLWKLAALMACITISACAVYDKNALPEAGASLSLAMDRCNAAQASMHSVAEGVECILAADRQFAVAIHLRKMELYDTYAARLRLMAQESDAGKITPQEMATRYTAIRTDYVRTIADAQENARQRAMAIGAGLAAAGQSMQREADRQAYIQAHQQQPLNCTSTGFGNTVTTHCN